MENRLESINQTIRNLNSLGIPIPPDLLSQKEYLENQIERVQIQEAIKEIEDLAKKVLVGFEKTIDVNIYYNGNDGISFEKFVTEYKAPRDTSFDNKCISVYYQGYIMHTRNEFTNRYNKHFCDLKNEIDCKGKDFDYLILMTAGGFLYGIYKGLLRNQAFGKLIKMPALSQYKIIDGFLCKENDVIRLYVDQYTFEHSSVSIKEFIENHNNKNGTFGPFRYTDKQVVFANIKE